MRTESKNAILCTSTYEMVVDIIQSAMNEVSPVQTFPMPTIRRYPIYLRCIRDMIAAGHLHISSAVVAEALGFDPRMCQTLAFRL